MESVTRAVADRLQLSSGDRSLATLSPAHVGGLMLIVRAVLLGGTLIALGKMRLDRLSATLDGDSTARNGEGRLIAPTRASLVPTQLHRILEMRGERPAPAALRSVLIGGAHAPAGLVERGLQLGWPLALTYGATEMSSQAATASPEVTRSVPGTVGAPLDCVEVRIADDGEVLLRGPSMALARIGEQNSPIAGPDGWYRTGDLGRLDVEGRLWITGRRADRIVTGGVTVEATEVEEALRAHPAVIDACVAGVPDEEWGEVVGAWVEPVEGEFDVATVEDDLRSRLADSKLPRVWHVAGGIPRNANEKVDRAAVGRRLQEAASRG
jgi:O-succinylbenzoic acid--CoA ligase